MPTASPSANKTAPILKFSLSRAGVEHDPSEILMSQLSTLRQALASAQMRAQDVSVLGITNQRETVIVWDRETGRPIYNAIVWQCRVRRIV